MGQSHKLTQFTRQAKVDDLDPCTGRVHTDDVLWLEVQVDDVLPVNVLHALQDLHHVAGAGELRVLEVVIHNAFEELPARNTEQKKQEKPTLSHSDEDESLKDCAQVQFQDSFPFDSALQVHFVTLWRGPRHLSWEPLGVVRTTNSTLTSPNGAYATYIAHWCITMLQLHCHISTFTNKKQQYLPLHWRKVKFRSAPNIPGVLQHFSKLKKMGTT